MGIFDFAFLKSKDSQGNSLPSIFPLQLTKDTFVRSDILHTYTKILTDTLERTYGLDHSLEPLLWDNYIQSEANLGLVSLLAEAMTSKADLYLVYKPSVKVLRKATPEEEQEIRRDYEKSAKSSVGVFLSFKNYRRTDMLNIYSHFEYCVLASLNKTLNLSKAIQLKMNDLRASVSLMDSNVAKEQAQDIARGLAEGNDVILDVKDMIETAKPDTSTSEKAILFLDAKKAFILGLPLSYVSGEQTPGIGSTGEADMRAVERGLKQYFVSIIRPTLKALFDADVKFKTQDFRQMGTALEALKTFDLVSDDNMSRESKQELISRMFDLDLQEEKKALKAQKISREKEEDDLTEPRQDFVSRAGEA